MPVLLKNLRKVAGGETSLIAEGLAAGEDSATRASHRWARGCRTHGVGDQINCAADDKRNQRQHEAAG
jgi:hypothetical protein